MGQLLYSAALKGQYDLAVVLVEYDAPINQRHDSGVTALMNAAYWGHVEIVKILCDHGALLDLIDDCGRTARDLARTSYWVEGLRRHGYYLEDRMRPKDIARRQKTLVLLGDLSTDLIPPEVAASAASL